MTYTTSQFEYISNGVSHVVTADSDPELHRQLEDLFATSPDEPVPDNSIFDFHDLQSDPQKPAKRCGSDPLSEVRVDYSGLFLHLAYARAGVAPRRGDLLALPAFSTYRQSIDLAIHGIIFGYGGDERVMADLQPMMPRGFSWPAIRSALTAHHPCLLNLGWRDLEVFRSTEKKLFELIDKELGADSECRYRIRKGVITAKEYADYVQSVMEDVAEETVGLHLPVSVSHCKAGLDGRHLWTPPADF